jgi:transcriptional regulator with XRE-family HTH domain
MMERLNEILHELGISKVKLAKFLGVSRQMIYNYLELDDINNWPKDKKVLLLNLLGIKSGDEIKNIKVDTDYILSVESRLNTVLESSYKNVDNSNNDIYSGLSKQNVELLHSVIELLKEKLEDNTNDAYYTVKYLYHTLQAINSSPEIKYMLGYISKASGSVKANEFVFEEEEQFIFESIMFSAMTLYNNGGASKSKLAESHKRFVDYIEHKLEEKMSRTLELNTYKIQALKELGYDKITDKNAGEVLEKIAEIQSRKITD